VLFGGCGMRCWLLSLCRTVVCIVGDWVVVRSDRKGVKLKLVVILLWG